MERDPARTFRVGAIVALLIAATAGCSSTGSGKPASTTTVAVATTTSTSPTTTTTTAPQTRPKAAFSLHEVMGQFAASGPPCTLTPTSSATQAILFDRKRTQCFLVGPVLLTGAAISRAMVRFDPTMEQWVVNLRWGNDDFLDTIANPLVHRQIAIVIDGVVQEAPTINPGFTGRDLEVSGDFSKAEAVKAAAAIMGIEQSAVTVEPRVD